MRNSLKILCFSYLLMCLNSMNAWFFWNIEDIYVAFLALILCAFFYINNANCLNITNLRVNSIIVCMVASMYYGLNVGGIKGMIEIFALSLPIVFFVLLKNDIQAEIMVFITKAFSIIFLFSTIAWILLLVGVNLPDRGIISHKAWNAYEYVNHFIVTRSTGIYKYRFNSIFLEPGHTGMIAAFLLYVNRFNFKKKYLFSILLALLLTLSLAGYVLLFIAVLLYNLFVVKRGVRILIILSLLLAGMYLFFVNYEDGDNIVNNLIIERLQIVDGKLTGNNRTEDVMDIYFGNFIESHDFLLGIGQERFLNINFQGGNSGYKVFLITYGLIGLILTFTMYLFFSLNWKSKESFLLLALYSINFWQRSYPYWSVMLLIFIGGISLLESTRKQE